MTSDGVSEAVIDEELRPRLQFYLSLQLSLN